MLVGQEALRRECLLACCGTCFALFRLPLFFFFALYLAVDLLTNLLAGLL